MKGDKPTRVQLVQALTEAFGKEFVVVRTQHHIQLIFGKVKHDVWMNKDGVLKYKLHGQGGAAQRTSLKHLLKVLDQHKPDKSDLARMQEAHALAESITGAQSMLASLGLSAAIFCDAGTRDGLSRMAWIFVAEAEAGPTISAKVWHARCTISTAETSAILHAAEAHQDSPELPIFSDNKPAVDQLRKRYGKRIRWVPRWNNKAADKLANLRGAHGKEAVEAQSDQDQPTGEDPRREELSGETDSGTVPTTDADPETR